MRAKDYGFAYIKAMDKLTLDIQQYSIDQSKVIDHFVIKKSDTYPKFGNKLPEKRVDWWCTHSKPDLKLNLRNQN